MRGLLLLVLLAGCTPADGASVMPPPRPDPGTPLPLDVSGWVSSGDGTVPLVLIAPHGGDLAPTELPDRDCAGCETTNDANTQALAIEISAAFERRVGKRPFVIINRLHRRKFDANRDQGEATDDYAPLFPLWTLFHERIDSAKARALRLHSRALVIDLHGHAHAVPRLELGYLLSAANLRLPDVQLRPLLFASSVAGLDATSAAGDSGVALLRGPRALGTRLALLGYPAVPSATDPAPLPGESYFSGGHNTARHGSLAGGRVDAVQLECHFTGVRDTAAARTAFAEALVTALLAFLDEHYDWSPT
ncbi:MAG: hypothetical protein ACKVS7_11855 [Gemmatimonadaceae bacterium]